MGVEKFNYVDRSGGEHGNELLDEFLSSENGRSMKDKISESGASPELHRRVAGVLFENIGYKWMKRQVREKEVLLSPKEVFKLWKKLYPDGGVEFHGGFNTSMRGISVPDGLMIKEEPENLSICSVVEYKIVSNKKMTEIYPQIKRQARHFRQDVFATELQDGRISERMGKVVHEMHNELESKPLNVDTNLNLIYVIPADSFMRIPDTIVKRAPVTRQQLYNMKELLFKKY